MNDRDLQIEFLLEADERDHDFRLGLDTLFLRIRRRFEHRARLHFGDLRILDAETAAAEAEHWVELVEFVDAVDNLVDRDAELLREVGLLFLRMRKEFVERGIEETNGRRETLQLFEDAEEVVALVREQLLKRVFAHLERIREDHFAHRVDAVAFEEHVFGTGETNTGGTERESVAGLLRIVRVRANL